MTTIPHTRPAESLVSTGVAGALAARGITVTAVEMLFDGREWAVSVSSRPEAMSETEVRVAVWTAVLNYTAVFDVPAPTDGVRISLLG
ncbi:hypothetical protein AVL61_08180 [Kocuria rosea subsp. polaris]|uniref:Uncharacterized protein n=1 Tax=Kocuria rosea subsp. polaris TaxID=136273 RepID=A0A0W8IMS8_KOCRO|nr:hypothetical protein [Kocuria polaris]KUG61126.1 hypothetical protein AVL61_08180 [Kocuria polaris]